MTAQPPFVLIAPTQEAQGRGKRLRREIPNSETSTAEGPASIVGTLSSTTSELGGAGTPVEPYMRAFFLDGEPLSIIEKVRTWNEGQGCYVADYVGRLYSFLGICKTGCNGKMMPWY